PRKYLVHRSHRSLRRTHYAPLLSSRNRQSQIRTVSRSLVPAGLPAQGPQLEGYSCVVPVQEAGGALRSVPEPVTKTLLKGSGRSFRLLGFLRIFAGE